MEKTQNKEKSKKRNSAKILATIIILIIIGAIACITINTNNNDELELEEIKSKKELKQIYNEQFGETSIFFKLATLPFSFEGPLMNKGILYETADSGTLFNNLDAVSPDSIKSESAAEGIQDLGENLSIDEKDYSKTNIQVENVDEADITKTDGDYIYSISENNVVITDVKDPKNIKIATKISEEDDEIIPEDLILYQNKLVIIYEKVTSNFSSYYHSNDNTTIVKIYNIANKENPIQVKSYELMQPYYTSRCINGRLYVISSGSLIEEDDDIVTYYRENNQKVEMELKDIKRIPEIKTSNQTIMSMLDLNNVETKVKISSYLMDIQNAYVSENNIYLIDYDYNWNTDAPKPYSIFGLKGIFGAFEDMYESNSSDNDYITRIYKFNIMPDGTIKFDKKATTEGRTLNQFSADEKDGNLRIAVYGNKGTKIVVFDKQMKVIGETEYLAKGEKMYSSRFIGDRAYLVTCKTIDPLFVVDLSNPTNPTTLGKLKIPGYSTYLHPYDDNHIIGIGMQTEEKVNRNSSGKVISTTATITGMKMALFDVSNVNKPIQISEVIIGDSRTTSAVLTNHKALLFSKEKELLAIPVNNYEEDFQIQNVGDTYDEIISEYTNYNKKYVSEGYFVYKINLTDGFSLKGTITHNKTTSKYGYWNNSKLLRGLYIDDNLFTISEDQIKVNRLEDLEQISELKVK